MHQKYDVPTANSSPFRQAKIIKMSRGELIAHALEMGFRSPLPCVLEQVLASAQDDDGADGYWHCLIGQTLNEMTAWSGAVAVLRRNATIRHLCDAMTAICARTPIVAPTPSRIFHAYRELTPHKVSVVFVGQDPYPSTDKSKATLAAINKMSHASVAEILGAEYYRWPLIAGTPWADDEIRDEERPRVRFGAVPYACGKSFAYPSICKSSPGSYESMRDGVKSSGYPHPKMDPELNEWSKQGILMLNACPVLYEGSGKNPNAWTAFTVEILTRIALDSTYGVFVLLGNSAKFYKKAILKARSTACIVETGHPSKRNTAGSFQASNVFSAINAFRSTVSANSHITLAPIKW